MSCLQCQSSVLCFWHRRSPHDDYVHVLLPAHTLVSICKHAVVGLTVNEFLCRHSKAFLAMKTGLFSQADFDKMASIELEACELWGSQVPNSYSRHIIIHFHGVNCQINPVSPHVKLDFVLSCYIARLMNFCQAWQGRFMMHFMLTRWHGRACWGHLVDRAATCWQCRLGSGHSATVTTSVNKRPFQRNGYCVSLDMHLEWCVQSAFLPFT